MSVQVEPMEEKNMIRMTIEVPAEELDSALQEAYQKTKKDFSVPGFRKGKVPRNIIEQRYGPEVFYDDAADILIPEAYSEALKESGEDVVSRPVVDIVQIEKGKPFIFTAEVAVRPEVTLGPYEGVEVTIIDTDPTDEEIDAEINRELENNARIINIDDRPIEEGDTAVIDFEGFMDGEPFEGGAGENYSLDIGSNTFIPGFEEQLIGKNAGEDVDVVVTFPEDYHAEDLAGKEALFKVTIHEVKTKELPELDDEFAQDVSEFDTVEEYRQSVGEHVKERKENDARNAQREEALAKIVEASEMDIPEAMIDTQCRGMMNQIAQQLAQQGLSFDQYLEYTDNTYEGLQEELRPNAIRQIQDELVLDAIAADAGIEITDEDIDEEIKRMADRYQMEADQLKEYIDEDGMEDIRLDLISRRAYDLIADTMKPVLEAPEETPEDESDEQGDVSGTADEPEEEQDTEN